MDKKLQNLNDQELEQANGGKKGKGAILSNACNDIAVKDACIEADCTWENERCVPAASGRFW